MDRETLKLRTKDFALRVIRLVAALPRTRVGEVLGRAEHRAFFAKSAHTARAHAP